MLCLLFEEGQTMIDMGHVHLLAAGVNIGSTKAAKTVSSLVTGLGGWIGGLAIPAGGLMVAYHGVMRMIGGGDAQTDAHHLAAMKKVLWGTALVAGAGGLAHFMGGLF